MDDVTAPGPSPAVDPAARWHDALTVAALIAIDPAGLGGVLLRARPGVARDRWLETLRNLLPSGLPLRRLPAAVPDDRLIGGLDLTATLRAGRPVAERGLLAQAHCGILVAAMAERMEAGTVARLSQALDRGEVVLERDGMGLRLSARIGLIALDEGADEDERAPDALAARLAFRLDLDALPLQEVGGLAGGEAADMPDPHAVLHARRLLPDVRSEDGIVDLFCSTALAFGVDCLRAPLFALRAARAHAALRGALLVEEEDAAFAARLVFAPRATRLPPQQESEQDEQDNRQEEEQEAMPPEPPPPSGNDENSTDPDNEQRDTPLEDLVLEATKAALPADLLAALAAGVMRKPSSGGKKGASALSKSRGRPSGTRQGALRAGARLALMETLRAAAPWQAVRGGGAASATGHIVVRPEDIRVRRYRQRLRTATIFAVDASGSSALHRLAEAKGAVELLLADCYVRRDEVALVVFRGQQAELALPPTRSLARARRCLAGIPGGGGTPLAAGIDAAAALAASVRRKGQTPILVVLTDGKANVARDGAHGRAQAQEDARQSARVVRAGGYDAILIDTGSQPQPVARAVADELGARYLALPHADAAMLSRAVRAAAPAG